MRYLPPQPNTYRENFSMLDIGDLLNSDSCVMQALMDMQMPEEDLNVQVCTCTCSCTGDSSIEIPPYVVDSSPNVGTDSSPYIEQPTYMRRMRNNKNYSLY